MQIESCINWEALGSYPREQYQYRIERGYLESETLSFVMEWNTNFIMAWSDVERIKASIAEEFPDVGNIKFKFTYEDMFQSEQEIIHLAIDHMVAEVNGDFAHMTRTIQNDGVTYEDKVITIPVLGDSAAYQLNKKVAGLFERILARDFGLVTTCQFRNNVEQYEEVQKEKEQQDIQELSAVKAAIAQAEVAAASRPKETAGGNGGSWGGNSGGGGWSGGNGGGNGGGGFKRRDAYTPVEGNRIMGKPISGETKPMKEVNADSGNVIVEGRVFKMENRELKNS